MGMFSFFKGRRERESALPPSSNLSEPGEQLGSFANPEGQPVVGKQVGGAGDFGSVAGMGGLEALAQLGPMIQQAIATGNVQIQQGTPQEIDLRGNGDLREQILGIMQQHGIDAEGGTATGPIDAGSYGDMQRQILEALSQHGVDFGPAGGSATGFNVQIEPDEK